MPATRCERLQRCHQSRHQRQRHSQVATALPRAATRSVPTFVPLRATPKGPAEASVIIELPLGEQSVTVKWPASDPEGCARFVRGLAQ